MPQLHQLAAIPAHADRAWCVAAHPTLPLLATASADRTSALISLAHFRILTTLDGGHKRSIRSIAWRPTPTPVLATASFDATVGIWEKSDADPDPDPDPDAAGGGGEATDEWSLTTVLDGHENEVKAVAWSGVSPLLATCSRDKTVWIWDHDVDSPSGGGGGGEFETIAVLQDHTQDVKHVRWHPSEELLASCSYDDTIRMYREDPGDGEWACCAVLEGHAATVWCVDFEPEAVAVAVAGAERGGSRLVSSSDDLTVRIWARTSGPPDPSPTGGGARAPSILRGAPPPSETWVLQGVLPPAHTRAVYAVAWSAVSGRIVSCGGDGAVVVYAEDRSAEGGGWGVVARRDGAHGVFEVNCAIWAKRWDGGRNGEEGQEVVVSCGDDGVVGVWEVVDD